jgi:hypothetical protein
MTHLFKSHAHFISILKSLLKCVEEANFLFTDVLVVLLVMIATPLRQGAQQDV